MNGLPKRVILEKRNGRLGKEEQLIADRAKVLGIPVETTTEKVVSRNFFEFKETDLVVGCVQFMKHALRAYGKELSEHTPYPGCLTHLLYRKVRYLPLLADAKLMVSKGEKLFIKPATWKRFTGFVTIDAMDFRFNGASDRTPVFIAEPVQFLTEWRVYVVDGRVRTMRWAHEGDPEMECDPVVIEKAVHDFKFDGSPAGYAIDFGVLSTGETALVEVNDGFAIGAYGDHLEGTYWDVLSARWQQLIGVSWNE